MPSLRAYAVHLIPLRPVILTTPPKGMNTCNALFHRFRCRLSNMAPWKAKKRIYIFLVNFELQLYVFYMAGFGECHTAVRK